MPSGGGSPPLGDPHEAHDQPDWHHDGGAEQEIATEPAHGFEAHVPDAAIEHLQALEDIPRIEPEDFKISLEGNLLTIQGTKQEEREQNTERVHRYERMYGAFERSFTLPSSVEPKDIKANYDTGVLTITLPKSEKAKPRQIEVKTGNGSKSKRSVEVEQQTR